MYKLAFLLALFGSALAGVIEQQQGYGAPAVASYGAPAAVAVAPALKSTGPQGYQHQIPAAAIRNVETVGVTKTITPVVTKTTTHQTHSEPALSVGHVQGYTQHAQGSPSQSEVKYNTQYTQYLTPTIGVNGPVTYTGPAIGNAGVGVAVAAPVYAGLAGGHAHGGQAIGYNGGLAYGGAQVLAAQPALQLAPQIGYSGIAGYSQPALLPAAAFAAQPAYQPASIQAGSYGGAQYLSDGYGGHGGLAGLSAAYGLRK